MMRKFLFLSVFSLVGLVMYAQKEIIYPLAPKDTTTDKYFGSIIKDPYQWMENPEDPRLAYWLESQTDITKKKARNQISRETLKRQIFTMYSAVREKTMRSYKKNDKAVKSRYEFEYNYKRMDRTADLRFRIRGKGNNYRMLVRVKDFQRDKNDKVDITRRVINEKENLAAVEMSHSGSDWREVYFFDLGTGKQLSDTLLYLRAGSEIIWDGRGVYYDRYDKPEEGKELLNSATGQSLYYHSIGTSQEEDVQLYKNPSTNGAESFAYGKMDDKRLLFHDYVLSRGKIYRALSYATLEKGESFFLRKFLIYPNDESINFDVEAVFGDTIVLNTTWNAPNGKVLAADINQLNKPVEIVPEYDVTLRTVNQLGKDKIACIYRKDDQNMALIFNLKGELLKKIDIPKGKKVNNLYEEDEEAEYTNFSVSSFYHPDLWYQLSLKDLTFKPSVEISVPYDVKKLETRYVKFKSEDGTEIPMYITCLKDTKLNGKNPTLLYGYGGYGTTVEPNFDESQGLWLLHGGILAIPNIRGGGAEGSDWALSGRRLKKQNAIDDFIGAAEFLISEGYTSPEKLAVNGGSHGGLLVGATITQRPDLFKAAVAEAGAFDMLRFEKFTVGAANTNIKEFGTSSNEEDFNNLITYSPLHAVRKNTKYPNVLLMTGDNDDRVPPLHSYKFLATLQELGDRTSLYHIFLTPGAGHGGALTPDDWVNQELYKYYFLFDQLGLRFK